MAVHALALLNIFNPHSLFNPVDGTYFFDETLAARAPQSVWDSFYSKKTEIISGNTFHYWSAHFMRFLYGGENRQKVFTSFCL